LNTAAMADKKNPIRIGMPGAGKTTLGRAATH
jgi:shikimate kinase